MPLELTHRIVAFEWCQFNNFSLVDLLDFFDPQTYPESDTLKQWQRGTVCFILPKSSGPSSRPSFWLLIDWLIVWFNEIDHPFWSVGCCTLPGCSLCFVVLFKEQKAAFGQEKDRVQHPRCDTRRLTNSSAKIFHQHFGLFHFRRVNLTADHRTKRHLRS